MRSLIIFLLICIISEGLRSQDSLRITWQDTTLPDSTRLMALHKFARSFLSSSPDSTMFYASEELDYARALRDTDWIGHAHNTLGSACWMKGEYPEALDHFYRALDMRTARKDSAGMAACFNNIGNIYFIQGYYSKALDYYFRSLEIEESLDNTAGIASSYLNIGSLYGQLDEYEKGMKYFQDALELHQQLENPYEVGSCYHNIGRLYQDQGLLDSAEHFYKKGIDYQKSINDQRGLATSLANLAEIYRQKDRISESLELYRQSEEIREQIGDKKGIARTYVNRGLTYNLMNNNRNAREQCLKGLEIARAINAMPEMKDACKCLYVTYRALEDNEQALKYFEEFNDLEDSLAEAEVRKQLQLIEFRKQVSKDSLRREEEKALLQLEYEKELQGESRRKIWLTASGFALLLISAILLTRIRQVRKSKRSVELQKEKADKLLLRILPGPVARELLEKGKVDAKEFQGVTVLFTDFIKYTQASVKMLPHELLREIDQIYQQFDVIVKRYGVEKIKTIGDAYMAAGGIPVSSRETTKNTVLAALEMQEFVQQRRAERTSRGLPAFAMRVGIDTGPVVAGILGVEKFQYDIWGDTVNVANKIEKRGEEGKVIISRKTWERIAEDPDLHFREYMKFHIEEKGTIVTYSVSRKI